MSTENSETPQDRQAWMAVLATADTDALMAFSDSVIATESFQDIRTAEVGLTQVRGRMGGTGSAFNLGDMTITRCVTRSQAGHYGYSYVAGRCKLHAQRAAELDALLQSESHYQQVMNTVVQPLLDAQQQQDRANREKTESTRVNFFTLVRGED